MNKCLSEIAEYNFKILKKSNINCFPEDGLQKAKKVKYDVIYVDPSRRHQNKGKVFYLKDCEPNIPLHLSNLIKHSKSILIKTSPMLDISIGLIELQNVSEIHIVSVNNEVKELLWLITPDFNGITKIKTIDLNKFGNDQFEFDLNENAFVEYSDPKKYLYEPNAAILKSGAFNLIPKRFNILKLHKHSHLYTHNELINFPGRKFKINAVIPYQKKYFKEISKIEKANISIRNFPESVSTIRKKLKINDGGEIYLFFTTTEGDKKIIVNCTKV